MQKEIKKDDAPGDEFKVTVDHHRIKQWAKERFGRPGFLKDAGGAKDAIKILAIDFGEPDVEIERLSWDEFFALFEESKLALMYQDAFDKKKSHFYKFVKRTRDVAAEAANRKAESSEFDDGKISGSDRDMTDDEGEVIPGPDDDDENLGDFDENEM